MNVRWLQHFLDEGFVFAAAPSSSEPPLPPPTPPNQHFIVRENEFTEAKFPRPIPPYPHDNCFGITEREDCPRLQGSGRRLH